MWLGEERGVEWEVREVTPNQVIRHYGKPPLSKQGREGGGLRAVSGSSG